MDTAPALLLIAHGTRDPAGAEEMDVLCDHLRRAIHAPVVNAWLEDFAEPHAVEAVAHLERAAVRSLVTLPLLTFTAGHAKTDVPGEVVRVRAAFPGLDVRHGRVLGHHPALFSLASERVRAVSEDPSTEVLVVAASGSSDPDANGELAKAARVLAEHTGHRWVEHCFAGVTWPRIETVLERAAAAGAERVVVFSWSLLAGRLAQRVRQAARATGERVGLEIADAGRLGPDRLVAEAVLDRYREAVDGGVSANCDLCCYRVPLPGLEDRVGAPSPGGTAGRDRGRHVT